MTVPSEAAPAPELTFTATDVTGRVVLLFGAAGRLDREVAERIAADLAKAGAVLTIIADDQMRLETLDVERMRAAGWVRG